MELKNCTSEVVINKSFSNLIIPFTYLKEYNSLTTSTLNEYGWKSIVQNERKNVLDYVATLIPVNPEDIHNGAIGKYYELDEQHFEKFHLPKNNGKLILITKDDKEFSFKVVKVSLYLFETKVGFLNYEIQHLTKYIEKLNLANYFLKHLHHFFSSKIYNQKELFEFRNSKSGNKVSSSGSLTLAGITKELLEPLNVDHYFMEVNQKPETALVFNFILLNTPVDGEGKDKTIGKWLFYLRRTFKNSYKPSPSEYKINENPYILQPFLNSYWGVSLEGLTNLVYLTGDKQTDSFFTDNYIHNVKSTYLYLYILALHQRFALLYLYILASDLPPVRSMDQSDISEESIEQIQFLRKQINFFILRCFFNHVSSGTHQQCLYEMIASCLSIEELKKDLHFELEALGSLTDMHRNEMKNIAEKEERRLKDEERERVERTIRKEQETREKNSQTFLIYSTLFVVISTITGAWTIIADLFVKETALFSYPAHFAIIVFSFVMVILGAIGFSVFRRKP